MEKYIAPGKLQRGDVIGRGAFGLVQRGRFLNQAGSWVDVAIKQSVSDSASSPSSSSGSGPTPDEQFVKEVSVTVDISGRAAHVVQCMGWSVVGEGQFALVMRLYDKSLHALIEEQVGDVLPLVQVVKIGLHIARGLLELHTEHIVFEDLKPHNVLLDGDGNAFLADFGLSKAVKDLSRLYTSNVGGTYFFMAPEKLRPPTGDKLRIGFASDVWAFGITMLQLLCSDTMAPYGRGIDLPNIIMMLMVDRQAPQVPAVPDAPELQHTLQACLSLDYKERPSAAQLVQTFEGLFSLLQSAMSPSIVQGLSASAAVRENEALKAQLATAEARAAADRERATAAEGRAAAAEQQLAQSKQQHRQEMARVNRLLEQKTAEAAAAKEQQLQRPSSDTVAAPAVRPLRLLNSPTCSATLRGHSQNIRSVAFTPDGATLVSGSEDKTIRLWDVASGSCSGTLEGHYGEVRCVAVSRNGQTLASGSTDESVRLWDLSSRACTAKLTGHSHNVSSVAFSPDGATIASASVDKTVRLWNTHSGSHKATLQGHSAGVYCVALSADGTRLASGGGKGDHTVRIWDVHSESCVATLKGHKGGVYGVVFSQDGAALLSGSGDNLVWVWDVRTGACMSVLQGHTNTVWSVALTPDGAYAASGCDDKTIKVWDWRGAGKCVATLKGHSMDVWSVAPSPDGRQLASGSSDNTIKLWQIAD